MRHTHTEPNRSAVGLNELLGGGVRNWCELESQLKKEPAITFEQWAAREKRTTSADVESHIHAGLRSAPTTKTYARWNERRLRELQDERSEALKEYRRLVEAGAIPMVEVSRVAKLQEAASGLPELQSTQAARRLLGKMGIAVEPPSA